ncbi:MAG: PIN domain-containing protein [Sideroxydans sp.]|nr:PIN domain-containing protein [Sideroxydans sp.]
MRYLLDVNVLIALIDSGHVQHEAAHKWFAEQGRHAWATCPLTENGLLRIVGNLRYPNSPGSPAAVVPLMVGLRALPGHVFWSDGISLLDTDKFDLERLLSASQVTDSYLLALAIANGGQLATFDYRLVTAAVRDGVNGLHLIKTKVLE